MKVLHGFDDDEIGPVVFGLRYKTKSKGLSCFSSARDLMEEKNAFWLHLLTRNFVVREISFEKFVKVIGLT